MPGIAGIISKTLRETNEKDLRLMIDCMMHESFYTSGTYINNQLGICIGWVSHKGSFSDCMPIFNEKRDMVLLFSGENFVDREVINQLKGQGHDFDSSNASYLVHLYEEKEDSFFQHLNGWFSGILVDIRKSKIFLFNDRYGMQRIYYYESKDAFLFSSEAKSLLKVKPELREIDMKSLGEFFSCGCVLQNRTLFPNVFLLPGGSKWTFHKGNNVKKGFYFKPSDWENQPILDMDTFYSRLRGTFSKILPRYFSSKQSIAMSLTGGLDTRMIMANRDNSVGSLPCYTFSGMYRDSYDAKVARKVADTCHSIHHVLCVGRDFLSDFPGYAEKTIYITDGCCDVLGSSEVYLHKLARDIAPIRMTGNYGSEVLRRQSTFKLVSLCKKTYHPDFGNYIQEAGTAFTNISEGHKLSFSVFKEIPLNLYGAFISAQSQLTLRTPYMDNDLVELVYQAPVEATTTSEISLRLISDGNPNLRRIITDRGAGGRSNYFFSKCTRLYLELLFKMEYYFDYGMPNWLAKIESIFTPLHLERLFLGRHKFLHYRIWFRNELSGYIQEILLDKRTASRPYLSKGFLEEMVNDHIKGVRNYTNEMNKILTTELIQRLLIEDL